MSAAILIRKASLLKAIEDAEQSWAQYQDAYEKAKVRYQQEARQSWFDREEYRWRSLRDYLSRCLKNGTPVTDRGIKESIDDNDKWSIRWPDTYSEKIPSTFTIDGVEYGKRVYPTTAVASLKSALDAIVQETVSWTLLKSLGYGSLDWLFTAAVRVDIEAQ